jgi:GNAT superfamily N-acetyltransferase
VSAPYAIRPGSFEDDRDAILSLWAEQPDIGARADAKLHQSYLDNPSGCGLCVVLAAQDRPQPIGVICLHERRLWRGWHMATAAALSDFVVARAHRSLGPALALMKQAVAQGRDRYAWVYGLPNASSLAVSRRAGLREVARMPRMGKLLRGAFLLRRRSAHAAPNPALKVLLGPVDAALGLLDALLATHHHDRATWRATGFDDTALDRLWQQRPGDLLLSDRCRATLAWRFGGSHAGTGEADWQLALAEIPGAQPVAYVVWRRVGELVQIGDFLCTDPQRRTAATMLGFARHMRRTTDATALSLEFVGNARVGRGLQQAGFVAKPDAAPVMAAVAEAGLVPPIDEWYLTTFDRDPDV